MRIGQTFVLTLVFLGTASAQTREDNARSRITSVRYAPLAKQARIQGDVRLSLDAGVVTVLSGHPMLARTAAESATDLASILGTTDLDFTYHFVLFETTTVPTSRTVRRGNAFERAVLQIFGLKTERVIHGHECQNGVARPNDLKIAGSAVEVWIFGGVCLQTEAATVIAKR